MTCAFCGRSHWDIVSGDTGGTPCCILEQSGSPEFLSKEEGNLLETLRRRRKLYLNRIPICLVSTRLPLLKPRDIRCLSLSCSLRFPLGIVIANMDLNACFWFTDAPRRVALRCAIAIVSTRLAFALAILGGKMFVVQIGRRKSIKNVFSLLRSL